MPKRNHRAARPSCLDCRLRRFGASTFVVASLWFGGRAGAQTAAAPEVTPPVVVTHVDAVYPPSSLKERKHADVVLVITVDVDGHVSKADVIESGGADLDEAAIVAVRQWTFVPAMRAGAPVASRIKVPFHFAPPAPPPELVTPPPTPETLPPQQAVQGAPAPPRASAAPPVPAAPTPPAPTEVQVRGRLEPREHGASDYRETLGELRAVPRANAAEALKLAPGFLLTNEGGSGHAEQVFLRGFDAHEGQDLEFSVDGVPINDAGNYHGNGYADTHFLIPELVESVRVLEGPYAPQQGDFAVAGSADYHLGLDRRGLTAEATAGMYGTQRLLLLWGPADAPSGTFAGAEYFTTSGFGTNRQAKRGTALGQYEIPVGERGVLRVTGSAYATEYASAGVVREDDYRFGRVGFFGTEDPNLVGNTATRVSLAATHENRFGAMDASQQFFLVDRTMRLLEDWTGFLDDVQLATQSPHVQRGDLTDFHFDALTMGGRGSARWHGEAFGLRQEIEGGYFARLDQTSSTQYRDMAANSDPYLTDADLRSTLGDIGLYADGNLRVTPWLTLRGGVRADVFLFDVLNNCAATASAGVGSPSKVHPEVDQPCLSELGQGVFREPIARSSTGSGATMPRASVVVGPFDHFEVTASAGSGVRSVDPSYVAQGLVTPFVNVQAQDLGVAYDAPIGPVSFAARSVFFRTHSDEDLLFNPSEGRSTLATGSTRTGWSGSARAVGSFFDASANATLVKATFDDTHLLVPYVPDLVVRGDVALFRELPWRVGHEPIRATLGYGVSYVGERPLPYSQLSDVIFVSDASVGVGWGPWKVRLEAQNLFDSRYKLGEYNYASDFHSQPEPTLAPERAFTAGAPRIVLLSISATLGGAS
jgi:TonB family protein